MADQRITAMAFHHLTDRGHGIMMAEGPRGSSRARGEEARRRGRVATWPAAKLGEGARRSFAFAGKGPGVPEAFTREGGPHGAMAMTHPLLVHAVARAARELAIGGAAAAGGGGVDEGLTSSLDKSPFRTPSPREKRREEACPVGWAERRL